MNQNQCVPSWELDHVSLVSEPHLTPPQPPQLPSKVIASHSHSTSFSTGLQVPLLDYEVAELTWENGQLTTHGLGLSRVPTKGGAWVDKQATRGSGTLESLVNLATTKSIALDSQHGSAGDGKDLVPLLNTKGGAPNGCSAPAPISMTMDALVPTTNEAHNCNRATRVGCSTDVGSCSAAARVPAGSEWSVTVPASNRTGGTCEQVSGNLTNGLTSTSLGTSPDNRKTNTSDDHDSVCHSKPQKESDNSEDNRNRGIGKFSVSTKRGRLAAIHNQSERKRRDKINQRMKTLQKLVPNSSKTDKASMLDEVIEYLKQLQAQVEMMSMMGMPSMMMPMAIQQQLQMSMLSQMGMGMRMGMAGMGMGMGMRVDPIMNMGINPISMPHPAIPPVMNHPSPINFMSLPASAWDGMSNATMHVDHLPSRLPMLSSDVLSPYLTCQPQAMPIDTYNRMAAMYQLLQLQQQQHLQQQGPSPNN